MKNRWLKFTDARFFVRKLNLKSWREWKIYCINNKPYNIPYEPKNTYKSEWISYRDWLGTKSNFKEPSRKYFINEDFFKTWSHDMAYILGFWFADGYMNDKPRYVFSISQHKDDKYILKSILKSMGSNTPIRLIRENISCIEINSKKIIEDIKSLGGKEKKSTDIKFPDVPKEYLSDFIRGYFDGDGSVIDSKRGILSSFSTGSKNFAYGLLEAIEKNTNIRGTIQKSFRGNGKICEVKFVCNGPIYLISFSINNTIKLRKFLYQNEGMKLFRKYNLLCKAGEIKQIKNGFLTYEEAKAIIRSLKLKSCSEWRHNYCQCSLRPINMPSSPDRYYKGKGWVSWKEFLGYEKQNVKGKFLCV